MPGNGSAGERRGRVEIERQPSLGQIGILRVEGLEVLVLRPHVAQDADVEVAPIGEVRERSRGLEGTAREHFVGDDELPCVGLPQFLRQLGPGAVLGLEIDAGEGSQQVGVTNRAVGPWTTPRDGDMHALAPKFRRQGSQRVLNGGRAGLGQPDMDDKPPSRGWG